jgi:hypothetical protein
LRSNLIVRRQSPWFDRGVVAMLKLPIGLRLDGTRGQRFDMSLSA